MQTTIQGKRISVHPDGQIFVDGRDIGLYRFKSDPKRWKNPHGTEIHALRGKSLEDVLKLKGYIC